MTIDARVKEWFLAAFVVFAALGAHADFEVYFMRHGETPWNRAKVAQGGVSYVDITDVGVDMAEESAKAFRRDGIAFDRIYTSPYLRARHTAGIIASDQHLVPVADARIRERDCVTCEGRRYRDGAELAALMDAGVGAGNESVDQVGDRAMEFLEKELAPLDGKVKRVLCVAHTVLLNILDRRLSRDGEMNRKLLPNCCVHVIAFRNGRFEMKERARTFYDPVPFAGRSKLRYVAHRGAGDLTMPEASRSAYADAVARQSDIVKLDLQQTKDGVIVMGHDPTLKRNMGWDVRISDLPYAEILAKGAFRTPDGKPSGEKIVRLDEALRIVYPIPEFWIDFKHFDPAFAERVLEAFRAQGLHESRIMVATFSRKALAYFRDHHPGIRRVAHVGFKDATSDAALPRILKEIDDLKLFGVNMPALGGQTTPSTIAELKRRNVWVSLWFVQDGKTCAKYRDSGCDAFVTDFVSRIRENVRSVTTGGY